MWKSLLNEVDLPVDFTKEKGDKLFEKYKQDLTDFGSKIWLDYS